jgi:superfamily I DNA/RNA helicase
MEVLVKRLLDDPMVQSVLSDELDLLMVDEFQDTNPMQLEIFLKLSRFARYSVWVGDPKQSIYGFRGAEPSLMEAIISSQGGLKKENILEYSWRSRKDIVLLTNAIFCAAFPGLPPEQVALQPKRKETALVEGGEVVRWPETMNALHHWHFKYDGEGRKQGKEWLNHCISTTLKTNLERGIRILPKGEKQYRLAQPGDVVILCRSNKDCQEMAEALHRAGLRAAISRAGLMSTAEARLILACLKFMLNKYDSLSIAEILLLAGRLPIEEIIEDRLDYLEKVEQQSPSHKWGEQNPFIQRLNSLRVQVVELSGAEILTLLLEELDLRRIIVSWGNVEQRLSNVDVLCSLAKKYEEACNRLHAAASLGGLLLWLNDLENSGADLQGSGENPEAVNVITYHKSKGLEYPVVICHSLEQALRQEVWGLSVERESAQIDLANLLGNRWIRLWVNPYADQFKGTLLSERLDTSPEKAAKREEALKEEARLMYVGITRARDYLVFPTRDKPPVWLNRVCSQGNEEFPALDPNSSEAQWEWEGVPLELDLEVFYFPNDFAHAHLPDETVSFQEERAGKSVHPPYMLHPDENHPGNHIQTGLEEAYSVALPLPEVQERLLVGKAFRAYMLAGTHSLDAAEKASIIHALLERYAAGELIKPELLISQGDAFWKWLFQNQSVLHIHRLFPVRIHLDGRLFQMTFDLLLETEAGLVAVFHLPFVGDAKARQKKLKELGGVVRTSKFALQQVRDTVSVKMFVHFVLYGVVVEVNGS